MSNLILVVDDEPDLCLLTKEILEHFGHQVATASNGREALQYLLKGAKPNLIFLDITMPIMSGREFLAALHSGAYPHLQLIPVVIISAVTDFAKLQAKYGCVAELRKPASIEKMAHFAEKYATA